MLLACTDVLLPDHSIVCNNMVDEHAHNELQMVKSVRTILLHARSTATALLEHMSTPTHVHMTSDVEHITRVRRTLHMMTADGVVGS